MSEHSRDLSNERALDRVRALLDGRALVSNYDAIATLAPSQQILPMLKANAYGHGALWTARLLSDMPRLAGFGVATFEEALELRRGLKERRMKTRIVVFAGSAPWTEEKAALCEKHALTAVIASAEDWRKFVSLGHSTRVSYEIKFNTGMNRLGIPMNELRRVRKDLERLPRGGHPEGVFTHLAQSESPEAPVTKRQVGAYLEIRKELEAVLPRASFHVANSGGIWNLNKLGLSDCTDLVRPGLSLYGVRPWPESPQRDLRPVMTLEAQVVATHRLKRGETVGYGARFRHASDEPCEVAILGAGYADGLHRALWEKGSVVLGRKRRPFLGVVSMDLCAVASSAPIRVGEWAELWGSQLDPWEQAAAAGTIPYEMMTSISARVARRDTNGVK